ncbi:MAG: metal ABC transporter solute-binding protein, Zn/Mn family [Opitutales bacterium]
MHASVKSRLNIRTPLALLVGFLASVSYGAEMLRIVATTTMVADLAQSVAGDRAKVSGLMGPGVDPHLYKATAPDINTLQSADLIFYNGLHLEGRLADILVKLGRRDKPVYAVTESIPEGKLLEPDEFQGHYDPHVWFDPRLWAHCIETVVNALAEVDPDHANEYRERGAAVEQAYQDHYQWGVDYLAKLPAKQRILITSHDAYNYFGRAFDFRVIGVQGISTQSEAGLADMVQIIKFIKENNIKAIFVESSVSPAAIQRISEGSGCAIGGELFSDAMGLPGHIETTSDGSSFDVGTYEGMVKANISTIADALQ